MRRGKKTYIAEMLLANNLITQEQLDTAILAQKNTDKKIGQILVESGYIEEVKLLSLLAEQLHLEYVDLRHFTLDLNLIKLLPEFYARHYRSIILRKTEGGFVVGMADPQDLVAYEEIERILSGKIELALIREDDLLAILDTVYRRSDEISHFAETLSAELAPSTNIFSEAQDFSNEDLPVVNLIRSIFEDASQVNASDIHIEPGENILRIRLRVDGVLQEQILEAKTITDALVQRIKLVAGLNISEKRLPQDGRFSMTVKSKIYDVRVSTIPTQYGESVVMRLLNQSAELLQLDQIGMPPAMLAAFNQLLTAAYGLVLIVGPTGSGKTTTLYSALNALNSPEDKIITVEDPIEYRLPRINQVQVNPKIGLTFASVLRSILRQDPDIIMIGELRDQETMEIALRSAMTGHFVLSTLHTNDTINTTTRLLDMGAEGYLVASVLRGIIAQRLVRRICSKCKGPYQLSDGEKAWLTAVDEKNQFANATFSQGKGCTNCHQTGYIGRHCVFELLPISNDLAESLRNNNLSEFIKNAIANPLYQPLVISGLELAATGITTVKEVIRMAGEV